MMPTRLVVFGEHTEVDRLVVVEDAHFGVVGGRLALAGIVLDEVVGHRRVEPRRLVERAVELDRARGPHGLKTPVEAGRLVVDRSPRHRGLGRRRRGRRLLREGGRWSKASERISTATVLVIYG